MEYTKEQATEISEIIRGIGYECTSYSGRGMYGEICLGVNIYDSLASAISEITLALSFAIEHSPHSSLKNLSIIQLFRLSSIDSSGFNKILYFPEIQYID